MLIYFMVKLILAGWLLVVAAAQLQSAVAVDIMDLPDSLQSISGDVFPGLKQIAVDVWNRPEISTEEYFAHDRVVGYFTSTLPGQWNVTPHAFGQPTAWSLTFENRPDGFIGTIPSLGFISEFDALPEIGHACGHNLILLNGLAAASLTRQALINYQIPGRITVIGSPDEEQTAGKKRLLDAGAFDDGDVWLMAHPTVTNAVQPMQARINAFLKITGATHSEAVQKAYEQLVIIADLAGNLPATASTATPVEDVGMFSSNVVQTEIDFGVTGDINVVNNTVANIKATEAGFTAVNYTIGTDSNGVVLNFTGPGGHASEGTKGPLSLAIETFRQLSSFQPSYTYYLPSNTSHLELDVTVSVRTRYDLDLPTVQNFVASKVTDIPDTVSWDLPYKALEVTPYFGQRLIDIMKQPSLNEVWVNSTIAPAATDAGWVQNPVIDATTRLLLSEARPMFHPNFGICPQASGAGCAFNHEPGFKDLAGTDLAYSQTEKMARALAQIAVELAVDPAKMSAARALVR